jgi:hypothetical protein
MQQKVQTVSLTRMTDEQRSFLAEEYQTLGFSTEVVGDELICYWGKPDKPKKKHDDKKKKKAEEPEHKPGQEKTARRLGR